MVVLICAGGLGVMAIWRRSSTLTPRTSNGALGQIVIVQGKPQAKADVGYGGVRPEARGMPCASGAFSFPVFAHGGFRESEVDALAAGMLLLCTRDAVRGLGAFIYGATAMGLRQHRKKS